MFILALPVWALVFFVAFYLAGFTQLALYLVNDVFNLGWTLLTTAGLTVILHALVGVATHTKVEVLGDD